MNCENRKARADASEESICPGLSLRGKGEREIAEEKEGWMKKQHSFSSLFYGSAPGESRRSALRRREIPGDFRQETGKRWGGILSVPPCQTGENRI